MANPFALAVLVAFAVLGPQSAARAATVSHAVTLGPEGGGAALPVFDPGLGTLTSARVEVAFDYGVTARYAGEAGSAQGTPTQFSAEIWTAEIAIGWGHYFEPVGRIIDAASVVCDTPSDWCEGAATAHARYDFARTLTAPDILDAMTASPLEIYAHFHDEWYDAETGPRIVEVLDVFGGVRASVEYDYDDGVPLIPNPVPPALPLLAGGLIGLLALGRRTRA